MGGVRVLRGVVGGGGVGRAVRGAGPSPVVWLLRNGKVYTLLVRVDVHMLSEREPSPRRVLGPQPPTTSFDALLCLHSGYPCQRMSSGPCCPASLPVTRPHMQAPSTHLCPLPWSMALECP